MANTVVLRMSEMTPTAEERYRLLVEGAKDYAMILLDAEGRITSWNIGAERIMGWSEAEMLGQPADLIFTPEDRAEGIPAQEIGVAVSQGKSMDLRWHLRKDGSRFCADGIMEGLRSDDGYLCGFAKVMRDATKRVEREGRERFLAYLAERARIQTDPDEVIADAVRSAGNFLGVSRCIFADIDIDADTCTIRPDYCADETVASIEGIVPISAFGPFVVAEYAARRAVAVDDVQLDPVKAPPETLAAYAAIGIRAHVTVPVVHSDRVVSCISVHNSEPRHWKPEEIELLRAVVERTWLTVEVLRQHRALVREAEERHELHKRTTNILESITDAFIALDRDFRFTYVNDQADKLMSLKRELVMGNIFWDIFPHLIGSIFERQYLYAMAEQVSVSFETFYPLLNTWLEVRAFPSPDGLSVYFRNIGERKAIEAEWAQIAEREHRIATQLQEALLPAIPSRVPGLHLGYHYRAALEEAGIGGDFAYVFSDEKGMSYLIIGDLAGKGLAAAVQIATITNMARYAVFRGRTLAGAVTNLNTLLVEQNLLTGFATFFIGRFDTEAQILTYVNAGQDAGLILRTSTGVVEMMPTTGPVLGAFGEAAYTSASVTLKQGDILALYTDGLTEAGPSRMELLTGNGVANLLRGMVGATDPHVIVERLMAGVDAHAGAGVRDDQCLLVGVVTQNEAS